MKKTSKILAIILAITMVISIIPITASAETPTSGTCGENATWEFDETTSTLTISGEGAMYDYYYYRYGSKVTDTRPWASYDDLIEFVVIDDGITHIGEYAFLSFTLLTIITIPDSVTSVGEYAFNSTEPMVVHYKGTESQWNDVTIVGANSGLIYERIRFYFVDFPVSDSGTWHENITWSFDAETSTLTISGTGIMNADFGEGGYHLGRKQFRGHRGWDYYKYHIEQVVITDGVTQIGGDVFRYHPNLKEVIIPNSIHTIDIGALDSGESLSDIYYSGTEEDWNNINIRECSLLGKPNSSYKPHNATIHFLGEEVHECSYNAVVTPPTCTEQGYTTYTCECSDSYVADYVNATGHNHASEITTPATHTTTGIETFTCECGDTYTEVIEKLEKHNYEPVVTAPTCTKQGYTTYTCVCGDSYVADYIDALGHTEEFITAVAPTCTESGLTEGVKCSVCGETLTKQKELPANGHTAANAVEENYIAPTCTENGSKDVVVYCSVGDEVISRETESIEATGHADNDGDGYCDACNEQLEDNNDIISVIISLIQRIINLIMQFFGVN